MHLLVVGATGRTGRDIVAAASAAGHSVTAFARTADRVSWPAGVRAIAGDALDPASVDAALPGVDAVVVALSMVRASDSPWAPILTPLDLHSRAASVLTSAAARHGVRRYVALSAHGVGDAAPRAGWLFLALVRWSNIGIAYANLAVAEGIVRTSGLRWTLVRPTRLATGPATGRWTADPNLVTTSRDCIRRADVAAFLVQTATSSDHVNEAVSLTGRPD
jgi:putative NADH-flavin reductase